MSTQYPILDNRPINKWKVAELKEELKRRNLMTKGLKDDLVKRLDEALYKEREASEEEASKALACDPEPMVECEDSGVQHNYDELSEDTQNLDENKTEKVDDIVTVGDIDDGPTDVDDIDDGLTDLGQGKVLEEEEVVVTDTPEVVGDPADSTVNETVVTQIACCEEALEDNKIKMENEDSKPPQIDAALDVPNPNNQVYEVSPVLGFQVNSASISTDSVSINEKKELKGNLNSDNVHLELDVVKLEMVQPSSSEDPPSGGDLHPLDDQKPLENQGSVEETDGKVYTHVDFSKGNDSADGESSVKLNHSSADDSMKDDVLEKKQIDSNHKSNEVGDKIDIIEIPVIKVECPVVAEGPDLSPEDMETSTERSAISTYIEEKKLEDDNKSVDMDFSMKSDMADGAFSEKLNLDQSPVDDSMEEDALETKQIDSIDNSSEAGHEIGLTDIPSAKVEGTIDTGGADYSFVKMESDLEKKDNDVAHAEKRKFQDEGAGISELPKRQRRWNSESLKIPEPQNSNLKPSNTPKDSHQTTRAELSFNRSDSTLSGDAPKERVVPPSPRPPTNSLRIDRFLRPFTLKAVQELLAKTGNVCSFWMDPIKTHCYVTYSSVEEAIETRNAIYNLQWPPNGGRLLVVEFVDRQEVKSRLEPPQSPAALVSTTPNVPMAPAPVQSPPSTRQQGPRQQQVSPPPSLQQLPPISDPPTRRERQARPQPEKLEPPIVTLDDLFRKTRTTPRIYYLPLTEEQIAEKLAMRDRHHKQ